VRVFVLMTLACLSACSWFNSRKPPPLPNPTEIIVTGAPAGSIVLIDGVPIGQATAGNGRSRVLDVAAGAHKVEIRTGDRIVYREDTYAAIGERTVVIVKSGSSP
jgi:hypothetical protein